MEENNLKSIEKGNKKNFSIKKKANYILHLSLKEDNIKISGSKSFYSEKEIEHILSMLDNTFNKKSEDSCKVKFTLIDKETGKSNIKYIFVPKIKNGRELIEFIKETSMKQKDFIEVTQNKFRIIIDNCVSIKSDSKSFSIISKDSIIQVYDGLKELFDKIINEEEDTSIIFDDKTDVSTHRVLIKKDGEKSRSFSIIFPNYSSSEVVDLLIKKIRGSK